MKNEPITILVDATGKNARPVNPYPTKINDGVYEYENRNHLSFEATVKYLPLTIPQIPNSVIKGFEVWQYRTNKDLVEAGIDKEIIWKTGQEDLIKALYSDIPSAIREAYEPLPIEEKEQVKEESLEEAARQAAEKHCNGYPEQGRGLHLNDFTKGAEFGANYIIHSNNLVSLDKVIEVVRLSIDKINVGQMSAGKAMDYILTQLKTLK